MSQPSEVTTPAPAQIGSISRSAMEAHHQCPRNRFLRYEALAGHPIHDGQGGTVIHIGGFNLAENSVALLTGSAIHAGFAFLLQAIQDWEQIGTLTPWREMRTDRGWHTIIDGAATAALAEFEREASANGISFGIDPPAAEFYAAEQRALIEGLVWVAGLRLVPELISRYRVLEIEREERIELAPGLRPFAARADALLADRASGDLSVFSLKTAAAYGRREEMRFKRDVQGMSEAVAIDAWLAGDALAAACKEFGAWDTSQPPYGKQVEVKLPKVEVVQMAILLKGIRRAQGEDRGLRKEHYSPLTRAWCLIDPINNLEQWAWSYDTPKTAKDGSVYMGKLGKEWRPRPTWERAGGVRQWVLDLDAGLIQSEVGDPLAQCMALPEPWGRAEDEMADWLEQARVSEARIAAGAGLVNDALLVGDLAGARRALNEWFPQDRRSCVQFNSTCAFDGRVCFNPNGLIQLSQGLVPEGLRPRIDHHADGAEIED